jgi:hypothetical protein
MDINNYLLFEYIYKVHPISRPTKAILSASVVSVFVSSVVDRVFESWSGKSEDYRSGICYSFAKQASLTRKRKDRLARNQDNVSEWGDMSIRGLLFQWVGSIKIQLSALVYYKVDLIIISLKINLSSPWYSWQIAELSLNSNHSLTPSHRPI